MGKNKLKEKCGVSKVPNTKLEFAEELNIEPRLRPSKTGSVAQNTARPVKKHK